MKHGATTNPGLDSGLGENAKVTGPARSQGLGKRLLLGPGGLALLLLDSSKPCLDHSETQGTVAFD